MSSRRCRPAYELDLFGRLADQRSAARDAYLASEAARDAARLSIAAATASAYLTLLGLDARLEVARATLAARRGVAPHRPLSREIRLFAPVWSCSRPRLNMPPPRRSCRRWSWPSPARRTASACSPARPRRPSPAGRSWMPLPSPPFPTACPPNCSAAGRTSRRPNISSPPPTSRSPSRASASCRRSCWRPRRAAHSRRRWPIPSASGASAAASLRPCFAAAGWTRRPKPPAPSAIRQPSPIAAPC